MLLDERADDAGIYQIQQEERLEDRVAKLWCGCEKLGRFGWVGYAESLHLAEDVEQLRGWNGIQRPADRVWSSHVRV